jgi:hypothetical protein
MTTIVDRASDANGAPRSFEVPEHGVRFELTCSSVPEQYDVFDLATGDQVAYVRLRFGRLTVNRPNEAGSTVYVYRWTHPENRLKGQFASPVERAEQLWWIASVVIPGGQTSGKVLDSRPPRP